MAEHKEFVYSNSRTIYLLAGLGACIALIANIVDIVLGFGGSEVIMYGAKSASEWYEIFRQDWFSGLYKLGLFNIIYMVAMLPVYLGIVIAHQKKNGIIALLALLLFVIASGIYISKNAAIPLHMLSMKYHSATSDVQKKTFISAGEAVLAQGEDFTPGSFIGLFLSGIAALMVSFVMLKGQIFGKVNAWVGIIGFTFLSLFTIIATFVPSLYILAFYFFGSLGGILALTWFILVSIRFFQLSRIEH